MTIIDAILDILAKVCVPNQPSPTSMKLQNPPKKERQRHSDFISIAFLDLASIRVSRILCVEVKIGRHGLEDVVTVVTHQTELTWYSSSCNILVLSTYASYIKTSFLTILGCECKLQLERAKSLRFDSSKKASLILYKTT